MVGRQMMDELDSFRINFGSTATGLFWIQQTGLAIVSQQVANKTKTNVKSSRNLTLRPFTILVRVYDLAPDICGIRFHGPGSLRFPM